MNEPRVVITTAPGSLEGLESALTARGAVISYRPLLTFEEPHDWTDVDRVIEMWPEARAAVFTSPRAAQALHRRLQRQERTLPIGPAVWAVGPATALAIGTELGPVHVPDGEVGGGGQRLADAMVQSGVMGTVFFCCGEPRRDELPDALTDAGIRVVEAVCYRSVLADESVASAAVDADVVVVGSPRVAALLAKMRAPDSTTQMVAIGATTAGAAEDSGWPPATVAKEPSAESVLESMKGIIG